MLLSINSQSFSLNLQPILSNMCFSDKILMLVTVPLNLRTKPSMTLMKLGRILSSLSKNLSRIWMIFRNVFWNRIFKCSFSLGRPLSRREIPSRSGWSIKLKISDHNSPLKKCPYSFKSLKAKLIQILLYFSLFKAVIVQDLSSHIHYLLVSPSSWW